MAADSPGCGPCPFPCDGCPVGEMIIEIEETTRQRPVRIGQVTRATPAKWCDSLGGGYLSRAAEGTLRPKYLGGTQGREIPAND